MKLLKCLNITRIKLNINLKKDKDIRSDIDRKYKVLIGELCSKNSVIQQTTTPYSP
jgi:hypothetical protein